MKRIEQITICKAKDLLKELNKKANLKGGVKVCG